MSVLPAADASAVLSGVLINGLPVSITFLACAMKLARFDLAVCSNADSLPRVCVRSASDRLSALTSARSPATSPTPRPSRISAFAFWYSSRFGLLSP